MREILYPLSFDCISPPAVAMKQGDDVTLRIVLTDYPDGVGEGVTASLYILPVENAALIEQQVSINGGIAYVKLDDRVTAAAGEVRFEFALTGDEGRISSYIFGGSIAAALVSDSTVESTARDGVIEALILSSRAPYIGENGDWYEFDAENGVFTDTGIQAGGSGGNSNYAWLPSVSTGGDLSWTKSPSNTPPATVNIKGADGIDGTNGVDGTNGSTFIPAVSTAGVISWTNDGGLSNPASVDIVTAVINALPSAVGVQF